jgi:hypothetical protein
MASHQYAQRLHRTLPEALSSRRCRQISPVCFSNANSLMWAVTIGVQALCWFVVVFRLLGLHEALGPLGEKLKA